MPSQCWRSSFKAREVRFFIRKLICITIMYKKKYIVYVMLLVIRFRIPT